MMNIIKLGVICWWCPIHLRGDGVGSKLCGLFYTKMNEDFKTGKGRGLWIFNFDRRLLRTIP